MSDFIETPTIGEILSEEFLIPLGISAYKLAQEINVPTSRIQDILHNRRKITVDTSLRLAKFFGLSDGYPVEVYNNGNYHGLYTVIIPKDDWMLGGDEDDPLFCAIQANRNPSTGTSAIEFAAKNVSGWDVEIGTFSAEMQTNFINAISFVMDSF